MSTQSTAYSLAQENYATLGVDTEQVLATMKKVHVSLHCWQADDVGGFEQPDASLGGGGIQATGNYPGKARSIDELRGDVEKALSCIPGQHRFNLHACYIDHGGTPVERDQIGVEHFQSWIDWGKTIGLKALDFNPTCFSHSKADDGFTLSHPDAGIRQFWIDHCKATRHIAASMGEQMGATTINNIWIPDAMKDSPADRWGPRTRLKDSLDAVLAEDLNPAHMRDAVESKLFGIGAESYTVGSHEFYLSYAIQKGLVLCLDMGHFHPTESVADKLSAVLPFTKNVLLHVSRGVRWDSDHVVILNDELQDVAREIVRGNALDNVYIGMDFFDASINRVAAYVIGTRNVQKAMLKALLAPSNALAAEQSFDFTARLAWQQCAEALPWGSIWQEFC